MPNTIIRPKIIFNPFLIKIEPKQQYFLYCKRICVRDMCIVEKWPILIIIGEALLIGHDQGKSKLRVKVNPFYNFTVWINPRKVHVYVVKFLLKVWSLIISPLSQKIGPMEHFNFKINHEMMTNWELSVGLIHSLGNINVILIPVSKLEVKI